MDAYLAIVSKREVRSYRDEPLPEPVVRRILDAGRVSGSSKNRQQWTFVVVGEESVPRLAEGVYRATNLLGAALVVAIVTYGRGPTAFDAGRVAQNMMLAAWNEGVGSCPNGVADHDLLAGELGLDEESRVTIVLSFGYPARAWDLERRSPEEWVERADRRPRDEVVRDI
jgi:nitroreductase